MPGFVQGRLIDAAVCSVLFALQRGLGTMLCVFFTGEVVPILEVGRASCAALPRRNSRVLVFWRMWEARW